MEAGPYLTMIHTKDIMDDAVVLTVNNARTKGEEQFTLFQKERLVERSRPVSDPLKKNNLSTFTMATKKNVSKNKAQVNVLKEDCSLFSRLYIACQVRDGNLEEFFRYENQPWPPSLAKLGQLRDGQKADLLKCLPESPSLGKPEADAVILDGSVIVQMIKPTTARTFDEYFTIVFATYVLRHFEAGKRVDLVWDLHKDDSLKKSIREKRGSGQRRKVLGSTRIPLDWKLFLRVDANKDELFRFISSKVREWSDRNLSHKRLFGTRMLFVISGRLLDSAGRKANLLDTWWRCSFLYRENQHGETCTM